ncbi:hypothetical protein OAD02_02490 [Alphaproteobacteria bacterium]|jgi:hypothetical protein|nr:hypothetical protein [Alphaproteobacteria bacterium]|tara:strand:+ start:62 stop:430 length:369 start_codon:yes stop_codon:yes gene_type:complete
MQSINNWITRVNSNKRLVHRGRWVNLTFTFGIDDHDFLIKINNGVITSIKKRTVLTQSGTFRIHGKSEAWEKHWLKIPPKDYHDIFAMLAKKIIVIDGNLIPLMQNLQYFKDIIISNGASDF